MRINRSSAAAPASAPQDAAPSELQQDLEQLAQTLLADVFEVAAVALGQAVEKAFAAPAGQAALGQGGGVAPAGQAAPPEIQPGLTTGDNSVTTPGGFRVFIKGPSTWEIVDPHGHCSEISGDPHVEVDEKHVFDFKRDTSFLLPDGTRIQCLTKPAGNGATLSSTLRVMAGGQCATFTGVETGQPRLATGPLDPTERGRFEPTEDVLSWGDENGHAGWSMVRDGSGHGRTGEVTGDEAGGEALVTTAHALTYAPAPDELGPCDDFPGNKHPSPGGEVPGGYKPVPRGMIFG